MMMTRQPMRLKAYINDGYLSILIESTYKESLHKTRRHQQIDQSLPKWDQIVSKSLKSAMFFI